MFKKVPLLGFVLWALTKAVVFANVPPTVSAGADDVIALPAPAQLNGSVDDDGLPSGAPVTGVWSFVSGPAGVTFANQNSPVTTAIFAIPGTYTLRLTGFDTDLSATDDVMITVNTGNPVNRAPDVSAGGNQTITFPNNAQLSGTATDDGLPQGATLTMEWSLFSGPGSVAFGNPNALQTSASFSAPGSYVLRFSVNDRQLTSFANVTITVSPGSDSVPPTVAITEPVDGQLLSNIVRIVVNAVDDQAMGSVQFFLDGRLLGREFAAPPYALAWDSRTVENGPHTLSIEARDAAGNLGEALINVTTQNSVINPVTTNPNPQVKMRNIFYPERGEELEIPVEEGPLEIEVVDRLGQTRQLWSGQAPAEKVIRWNGKSGNSPMASGMYVLQIKNNGRTETRKIVILK